jgi:hypothetical protein
MREESVPAAVIVAAHALCQAIVHEPSAWAVGAHREPVAWVHVVGIPDGSYGTLGR